MEIPQRRKIDHRGPMSIDVNSAWYFITICAEGHREWVIDETKFRDDAIAPKTPYDAIISTARHFQKIGKWKLGIFLVMPDHVHMIVHVPVPRDDNMDGERAVGRDDTPHSASFGARFARGISIAPKTGAIGINCDRTVGRDDPIAPNIVDSGGMGSCRPTVLAKTISDFKRSVSRLYGIRFQRDFWDTRIRDDAHYAEEYRYVCENPVRKGLCATACDWPHVITVQS